MNFSHDGKIVRGAIWIKESLFVFRMFGTVFFVITLIFGLIWISGKDVEPITFMFSLISTFFFTMPAIADVIYSPKPISTMNYDELLKFVETSDPGQDWIPISSEQTNEFFCARETRLRIVHHYGEDGTQNDNFPELWAQNLPDSHARGLWCDIQFDRGCIRRLLFVAVDGFRALLACPTMPAMTITPLEDTVGRIIAQDETTYLDYRTRAGINVPGEENT